MIHAVRSKPVVVGAARTVGPYFCTKDCSTRLSLSPRVTAAMSSLRMPSESGQPTWLHSSRIWLQPQMHISWWPSSLKRVAGSPAPAKAKTARRVGRSAGRGGGSDSGFRSSLRPRSNTAASAAILCCLIFISMALLGPCSLHSNSRTSFALRSCRCSLSPLRGCPDASLVATGAALLTSFGPPNSDRGGALGTRARIVPPSMIQTPSQIHITIGFRCALMIGWLFSFCPS